LPKCAFPLHRHAWPPLAQNVWRGRNRLGLRRGAEGRIIITLARLPMMQAAGVVFVGSAYKHVVCTPKAIPFASSFVPVAGVRSFDVEEIVENVLNLLGFESDRGTEEL
ncbi:hypothetical protein DL93DRAFT_2090476, partial [Clavulina sp. PMI_390]